MLELLQGLFLALTQAGSYMRETNMSASMYAKHFNQTWKRLMEGQDRCPLDEYRDRKLLTTWTVSYEQVQRKSKGAAWLLKLWGFLDNGDVWYEIFVAGLELAEYMDVPDWLLAIAEDELVYVEAMGVLSRYSLVDGKEGTGSHSMHSVPHRWCWYFAEEEKQDALGQLATGLVALCLLQPSDVNFWRKENRIVAHGLRVSGWVEGHNTLYEANVEAEFMFWIFDRLGCLLANQDRRRAEQMYQRALVGYEKALGQEHTSTLTQFTT